jgi:Flp pilus assembly protein TadG
MMSAWTKFRSKLRAFRAAQAGNVAIIFALASLPIIAFVGAAVDYSRANSVKAAMQSALDSTALMISKEASTDTSTQLQTNATNYFKALFTRTEATNVQITATYNPTSATAMLLNATASVPTYLLGIIGIHNIDLDLTSTSKWGETRLRVALVLDNTGSMAQNGKMTALIAATKSLLGQLQAAASVNGDVYVSIVPFVKDVNLDPTNYNSDYIYWGTPTQDPTFSDDSSWDANYGTCSAGNYSPRSTCFQHGSCSISGKSQSQCATAGTCSDSTYTTQSTCTGAGTCSISSKTSQSTCTSAGTCSISSKTSQSTCTSAGTCSISSKTSQSTCTSAGTCSISNKTTQSSCTSAHGTWTPGKWTAGVWTAGVWTATPGTWTPGVWTNPTWTAKNHNTWNGCVMDRGYPASPSYLTVSGSNMSGPDATNSYDTNVAASDTSIMSSLYAAEQYSSCPSAAVMGLNYNWSAMTSLVNSMSPNGNTNQAIGLQLGWLSLVGGGPFTAPPMDSNYKYTQVIILLTDGLNTENRWSTSQSSIDARQQLTCNNINTAGITLYTIQVNTGGDPTSTLLQNCAGSPNHYPDSSKFYLLTTSSQILNVFTQIGTELSQLRIAQ